MTCGALKADPLSVEPLIGVSAEYSSNPSLSTLNPHHVNDEALSVNVPLSYDLDSTRYTLEPSARYSDKGSYSSLDSDYYRLVGTASYSSDRQSLSLKANASRDSSFQQYALASNGVGVRADSLNGGGEWQYALSERFGLDATANVSRVLYNDSATLTGLVDYRYVSELIGPTYALSERDTLQLSASASQYESLDHITSSHSAAAQIGLKRLLTELWSLSTTLGYAKSENSQTLYLGPVYIDGLKFGPYYLGTAKSDQRGPVFSVALKRQSETLTVGANASRAYAPTGFEYLSRQDVVELDLSKTVSERWSYSGRVSYEDTSTTAYGGVTYTTYYYSGQLSATWHFTPEWMMSLESTWIGARYSPPSASAESTSVSLQISRKFLRIDLW